MSELEGRGEAAASGGGGRARKGGAGTVSEALGAAVDALAAAGVDSPRLDAELMLCQATGWRRNDLLAESDAVVDAGAGRRFGEMVRRRLQHEPVAYILGRRSFRYLELISDPRALVPRPETELLVELALELKPSSVLDIGTGSGAIALAVASELAECRVVATDTSAAALELARENALRLGLADRVNFELGTLPVALGTAVEDVGFDLVVANLPYVPEGDWPGLAPDIRGFEPRAALLGGPDGLDVVRAAVGELAASLERAGAGGEGAGSAGEEVAAGGSRPVIGLEIGEGQASATAEILVAAGWPRTELRPDLAGIERVVVGYAN